jgi:hypothetical protein
MCPLDFLDLGQCNSVHRATYYLFSRRIQEAKTMKNLSAILQAFRHDLPDSSLTARAIDRGALLEEISQAAAMERVHQLAAILLEAEQEETQPNPDREIDLETLISNQIRQLRNKLPDEQDSESDRRGRDLGRDFRIGSGRGAGPYGCNVV